MKNKILILFILCAAFCGTARSQYPFEQYKPVKKQTINNWIQLFRAGKANSEVCAYKIRVKHIFPSGNDCTVRVSPVGSDLTAFSSVLEIYQGSNLLQRFSPDPVYFGYFSMGITSVADFNGDSLKDIKIVCPYMSSGLGLSVRTIYLIQNPNGLFTKLSYDDMSNGDRIERDMDNDGKYITICMELENFKKHNYWTYNLYKFSGDSLIGVSDRFDYPVMIQFLNRTNYKPASEIPDASRRSFVRSLPKEFCKDYGIVTKK